MKKIFTLLLVAFGLGFFTLNAQALNQAANWPNAAWTLGGVYNPVGLLNDPVTTANFSFDDDAAGNGSSDILFVESPVIDLTAASAAGETLLNLVFDYDYNLGNVFQLEFYDADATAWVLWEILPDNSAATSNWCAAIAVPEVTSVDLNTLFFTANQQSGFKYRFHYESVATWGWGVCVSSPTIVSSAPPVCPPPTALNVSASSTSASLSWTENGIAGDWQIENLTTGVLYSQSPNPATISGLAANTSYQVRVRSICAPGDTSLWSTSSLFTTDIAALICGAGNGNPSLVYTEDFETDVTIGPGGSAGNVGPWTQVRTTDPDWTWDGFGGTGSNPTGPSAAHSGTGFVYLETSGAAQDADTLTSGFYDLSLVNTPARLRFWYHMFGADIGTMTVETSGDGGATWNAGIDFVGQQQASSAEAWKEAIVDITYAVGANNFQVRFIGDKNNGTGPNFFYGDMAIDFIQIEACVSCVAPTAPTATVISFDSAQIDFTSFGPADSTLIEFGVAGFTLGTGTEVSTLNNSIILAGLLGATSYDVYLISDCSGSTGDSSTTVGPVSFLTPCSPFTPVYFEDFSSWTGTTTLPICWEEYDGVDTNTIGTSAPAVNGAWTQDAFGNNAASPYSVTAFQGSASIELWNLGDSDWLVSPEIDLTSGGPYQLDYNWLITNWSSTAAETIGGDDYVSVQITSDGGATWTELVRYDSTTVVTPSLLGEAAIFDLTAYSGSIVKIGFWGNEAVADDPGDVKFFMDNFRVRPIPTCPEPISLAASNPTDGSVDLSWTETGSATEWEVQYGVPGFTPGTGTSLIVTGASNTTVTGLTEQTAYEFIVRAICAAADSSSYSFTAGATTLCLPIVAAVLEDFETVPFATFGDLGNCWSTSPTLGYRWESENSSGFNENSSGTGPFTDHTLAPAAGGIYIYTEASSGIAGDSTFLNSPLVDLTPLAFPNITFWYHMFGANMGELYLQINDGTGWTTISSVIGQQQTAGGDVWRKLSTNITAYTGIVSFRFIGVKGAVSFAGDISVDDVSIQEAPTNDIGVASIDAPVSGCGSSSTPLTITVDNFGVNDLFYVPVVVEMIGDFPGIYTLVIDTLLGESSASVTLGSLNTISGGSVDVTAFTNLANDADQLNDTILASFTFGAVPAAPAVADVMVCDGDSAVLGFNSLGALSWFETDTSSAAFFVGDTFTLAGVDTAFYVSQQAAFNGMATLDLFDSFGDGWNGHSLAVSINGASVVGSPFTIGTGNSFQVMFPLNNGDDLTLTMNTGGFAGEVSYTLTGPNGGTIFEDGFASIITLGVVFDEEVVLLGCPSDLTMVSVMVSPTYLDTVVMSACDSMTIAGATVTTSGVYTDSLFSSSGCDSVVVYNLTINSSYLASESVTICDGSSHTLPDGTVVSAGGTYTTVLLASNTCDSVIKTEVLISPVYDVSQNVQLCSGDTLTVGASQYTASGTYIDTLSTANGCDSLVTSNVVVFSSSDVSIAGVTVVCSVAPVVDLTLDPLGGTLSGPGVTGTSFDPAAAGVGTSTLVYSFADANGCDASASLDVEVVVCTGIEDIEGIETISIFPNPYVSTINVLFEDAVAAELNIKLFDITGKVILVKTVNTSLGLNKIALDVSSEIAAGVTMLQIERDGAVFSTTLLKK
ncbi:MAG: T9SS type A sorting domain-containing protein [Chitinophagales bacterium]